MVVTGLYLANVMLILKAKVMKTSLHLLQHFRAAHNILVWTSDSESGQFGQTADSSLHVLM